MPTQLAQKPVEQRPTALNVAHNVAHAELLRKANTASRRRKAVASVLVAATFLGAAVFWLATSGSSGFTIGAPGGTANGAVSAVYPISSVVTRSVGAANLQTGVVLNRLLVSENFTQSIKVSVAWINPLEAVRVLNNPNAQIAVGLYRPISTSTSSGTCTGTNVVKVVDDASSPDHDLPGGTPQYFCAERDTAASSSPPFDSGQLLLSPSLITGYLRPSVDGFDLGNAGTDTDLLQCTSSTTTWCQPADLMTDINDSDFPGDQTDMRVLWVVSSIQVPGGRPQGQQPQLNELNFNVFVKRFGAGRG